MRDSFLASHNKKAFKICNLRIFKFLSEKLPKLFYLNINFVKFLHYFTIKGDNKKKIFAKELYIGSLFLNFVFGFGISVKFLFLFPCWPILNKKFSVLFCYKLAVLYTPKLSSFVSVGKGKTFLKKYQARCPIFLNLRSPLKRVPFLYSVHPTENLKI